jgi:hypothetical protein
MIRLVSEITDFRETEGRSRILMSGRRNRHPLIGKTGLVVACAARGGGVSYRLVHQASMITSWAMPVSMV